MIRRLALVAGSLAAAMAAGVASAQSAPRAPATSALLGPTWIGNWRATQAVPVSSVPTEAVLIAPQAGVTRMRMGAANCDLRYDGQVSQAGLVLHVRELRDWQLRPEHWPAGTDPASLVGLRQEFHDAEELLQTIEPDSYRRVRARGPGCDSVDDVFWILHSGQRLFRIRFLAAGLGTEIVLFTRQP